jgi:hypothetical protein
VSADLSRSGRHRFFVQRRRSRIERSALRPDRVKLRPEIRQLTLPLLLLRLQIDRCFDQRHVVAGRRDRPAGLALRLRAWSDARLDQGPGGAREPPPGRGHRGDHGRRARRGPSNARLLPL